MFIATNVYGWTQIAERKGRAWDRSRAMRDAAAAGLTGWEDSIRAPEDVPALIEDAKAAGLEMRSVYIPGAFHDTDAAGKATDNALRIVAGLRPAGVTHCIFNPDPLADGALKTDAQLRVQRDALEDLGRKLKAEGARLLYHTHSPEMRAAAREFHHMLSATDPELVRFCLDVHWIYRGAGNSQVALEDIIGLYGERVDLLHLRQSHNGVWCETVEDGDVDFVPVADLLAKQKVKALLVLEHAYEDGTPNTLDAVEAHRRGVVAMTKYFGSLAA